MIQKALAHEEVAHESTVESTVHYLETLSLPYIAIPLFLVLVVLVWVIAGRFKPLQPHRALITLAFIFAAGIFGYAVVPAVGLVAIGTGFGLTLAVVFFGIRNNT